MAAFSDVDSGEADSGETAAPRLRFPRRWLQFSISTLLKLVVLAALFSAWWADRERLTDRLGKLENDQSVLRIVVADDVEGDPLVYAPGNLNAPPTVPAPAIGPQYGAYGPSVYGAGVTPAQGPGYPATNVVWAADVDLFDFLNEHKGWLKSHFAEDRGWQDFLAKGRPAAVPQSVTQSATLYDPYADPVTPQPIERSLEPALAPVAPPSRVSEPLEAPEAQAANPPSESPPLATPPPSPLAQAVAGKQCLPAVLKLLAGGSTKAKVVAARWLATMGSSAATSAPALADAANDPDPAVRAEALGTLVTLGPSAKSAAPRLAALLQAGDARSDALHLANVLLRIDPQADVVPRLVEALGSQQLEKRFLALQILSELGRPRAAAAAPAVAELLADEDARMRMEGAAVYSRLANPREAIPVLRDALTSEKNRSVKRTIAQAIMRLQNGP